MVVWDKTCQRTNLKPTMFKIGLLRSRSNLRFGVVHPQQALPLETIQKKKIEHENLRKKHGL